VHTDIKPSNIFVNQGGNEWPAYKTPVLGDFGSHKIIGVDHTVNDAGTPDFPAPEQHGPYSSITLRPDVFQIGLTIWSLMRRQCGGVNFTEREGNWSMGSVLEEQDKKEGYDRIYSTELEDLVTSCLHRDPAQRSASSRELC
jgi:serine/threonine protein kinase